MQKIPSLFQRNYDGDRQVRDEVVPGCEWVPAGEGVATRKFDGTCCMVRDGLLYKRYSGKIRGKLPADFEEAERDETTGKVFGWVPVGDGPEDQWHREAWDRWGGRFGEGTYELVGPKVQGGVDSGGYSTHELVTHGSHFLPDVPRTFAGIRDWLAANPMEGIVWHHPDGRMAKIKRRDFGLPWPL